MNNEKISVIIPAFNVGNYLERCLRSVVDQSYSNIEIIVIDDGSVDSTARICDRFAEFDSRIVVIHKENGGVTSARKEGIRRATGEYVLHVDGDDWIEPDRIKQFVESALAEDVDMVYLNGYYMDFGGSHRIEKGQFNFGTYFGKEEIYRNVICKLVDCECCFRYNIAPAMWSWVVKRELSRIIIEMVPDSIKLGEDLMFTLLCLISAESVTIMEDDGYHYYQRSQSIMGSRTLMDGNWRSSVRNGVCRIKGFLGRDIEKIIDYLTIGAIIRDDYGSVLEECRCFLFPFKKVYPGSKVVIYGAGNIGRQLTTYLQSYSKYTVIAWIDGNSEVVGKIKNGIAIDSVRSLPLLDYDYIVVAVYQYNDAMDICRKLLEMEIDEEKIALMDPSVLCGRYIPKKYKI